MSANEIHRLVYTVPPMNIKNDLQKLNNQLDVCKNKLLSAQQRNDQERVIFFKGKLDKANKKIASIKQLQTRQNSSKGRSITSLAFNRPLTQAEQADMGKLKKTVRGLIVVHPLTAVGREIGIKVVTGFAPKKF